MYKEAKFAADDAEETKSVVYQVRDDMEDLKKESVQLKNNLASMRDQMKEENVKLKDTLASMGEQMNKMMTLIKKERDKETKDLTMKPECSVCFSKFSSSSHIFQCINGHLMCGTCKNKLEMSLCLTCGEPVNGRATGLENYLKSLSPTSEFEFIADKITSHHQVKDVEDEDDKEFEDVLEAMDKICSNSLK